MISRVLIVGLGSIGKRHLELAKYFFPSADIRILRHKKSDASQEPNDHFFYELDQAITFSPQISIIANPASFHIQYAKALAKAGSHLLIEKPLSNNSKDIFELFNFCKANHLVLMVGYNLRFLPALIFFRKQLIEGRVGRILSVRSEVGQYLPTWRKGVDYRSGVSAREELGGGVLLELSHEIDYLVWIFGKINWVTGSLSKQSDLEVNVEDSAHLIFGFNDDANGHQLIGSLNLDYIRHDKARSCIAIGEKGTLKWDAITGVVSIFNEGDVDWEKIYQSEFLPEKSYEAEWEHFLKRINQNRYIEESDYDALEVLRVVDAVRGSFHVNKVESQSQIKGIET